MQSFFLFLKKPRLINIKKSTKLPNNHQNCWKIKPNKKKYHKIDPDTSQVMLSVSYWIIFLQA